jgi:hypothetical protein
MAPLDIEVNGIASPKAEDQKKTDKKPSSEALATIAAPSDSTFHRRVLLVRIASQRLKINEV